MTDHHYYAGPHIDLAKVREEARAKQNDKRHPESSSLHHHAYGVPCEQFEHEVFPLLNKPAEESAQPHTDEGKSDNDNRTEHQ